MTKEVPQNQATGPVFHLKHQHPEWRVTVSTTLINQISKAITSMPQFKKWFKILNKKSKYQRPSKRSWMSSLSPPLRIRKEKRGPLLTGRRKLCRTISSSWACSCWSIKHITIMLITSKKQTSHRACTVFSKFSFGAVRCSRNTCNTFYCICCGTLACNSTNHQRWQQRTRKRCTFKSTELSAGTWWFLRR